jgi:N-acetylneuraminic acid mutarotase
MKPKQAYRIHMILRYLCISCVIAFGVISIIGSGGGGGDDGGGGGGSAPDISNFSFSPTSTTVGSGGGTILVSGTLDFVDSDGNVSTLTLTIFDSNDNKLDSTTEPVQGISGLTSGMIQGGFYINTSVAGEYPLEIYITDTTNLSSNILTGIFTVTDDPWITKAPMPTPRRLMGSATVNGKIYVIGGLDGTTLRDETMVYDPATDTWGFVSSIPSPRSQLGVCAANGKIYAIGGNNLGAVKTVEEYDPTTDTWSTKSPMPTELQNFATAVVNGKIYAIDGENNEEYDPIADTWTTRTSLSTFRTELAAAVVNGKIYLIGGLDGLGFSSNVDEYDPATDTWSSKASMPTGRRDLAVSVVNGKIYAIGGIGYDPSKIPISVYDVVEEYDPATDTWATKTSMPTGREYLTASSVNNKVYALGGSIGPNSTFDTVEEYDPSKD